MTGLFRRLAARSRGEERRLRPEVPGLFQPQGADGDGFTELNEEVLSGAKERPLQQTGAPTPPLPPADEIAPPPAAATPAPEDKPSNATPGTRIMQDRPAAPLDPRVVEKTERVEHHETLRERTIVERPVPPVPTPARTDHESDARPPDGPPDHQRPRAERDTDEPRRSGVGPKAEPAPPSPVQAPAPFAAVPVKVTAEPPAEPQHERVPRSERKVHIQIDHIEVRQQPRPIPAPPPRKAARNPAPNLDDYLQQGRRS